MPVTFFKNTGKGFEKVEQTGIENNVGWFNSIVAGDFDNDGDIDYVVGNLGLNTNYTCSKAEPLTVMAKDIDGNGSLDAMVYCYMKAEDGTMKSFPMSAKGDLEGQVISMRKKFPTYKAYGVSTIDDVWNATNKQGALMLQANDMHSSYLQNDGNGHFTIKSLPLTSTGSTSLWNDE